MTFSLADGNSPPVSTEKSSLSSENTMECLRRSRRPSWSPHDPSSSSSSSSSPFFSLFFQTTLVKVCFIQAAATNNKSDLMTLSTWSRSRFKVNFLATVFGEAPTVLIISVFNIIIIQLAICVMLLRFHFLVFLQLLMCPELKKKKKKLISSKS